MWKLKKLNEDVTFYLISEKCSYTIGRKNCEILLNEDASISKKHCTIYVSVKNTCKFPTSTATGVWIVDEHSKYGTFIKNSNEWEKISPASEIKLGHGSMLKFGLLTNIWRLEYNPIIASTSGIHQTQKKDIENILKSIDGELRSIWSEDCSLLIVNEINLTVKVLLALINGIPIVTLDYVKELVQCVRNQQPFPNCADYKPVIKETLLDKSLVSLNPADTRKNLFKGYKFIFPTRKQYETLKDIILSASGTASILTYNDNWSKLGDKNVIVMQLPANTKGLPGQFTEKFQEVVKFLKNKFGKRVVAENEIAQAIAYSSMKKYCNAYDGNNMEDNEQTQSHTDLGYVIVEETPDLIENIITSPFLVPCSSKADSQSNILDNVSLGIKRKHSADYEETASKISRKEDDCYSMAETLTMNSERSQSNVIVDKKSELKGTDIRKEKQSQNSNNLSYLDSRKSDSFWSTSSGNKNQNKRKLSTEITFENEKPKKTKLPEKNLLSLEHECTFKTERANMSGTKEVSSVSRSTNDIRNHEEDLEAGFISKAEEGSPIRSGLMTLDKSMFSLKIISSVFLKEDGSLVDPPTTLVNVKKFKKQPISTLEDSNLINQADEIFDGSDWLEPHPITPKNR